MTRDDGGDSAESGRESQGACRRREIAARWLPWIAVPFGIALTFALLQRPDLVGFLHDDGVYVSMARSIAAGEGPVDGHMLATARTNRFPPLHPLALAGAGELLGVAREGVHRAAVLVALNATWLAIALFAFLRWILWHKRWPASLALPAAALCFTGPFLIGLAQHPMSECLFLALLALAVLLFERAAASRGWVACVAAGLAAGLLPATRTAGLPIALGLLAWHLLRGRSGRRTAFAAATAAAPWLALAAWSAASRRVTIEESALFGPPYARLLVQHLGDLPWIAWVNAVRGADLWITQLAPGIPVAGSAATALARAALAAAAVAWVARGAARGRRGIELFVLVPYAAALLPWPFADLRFLVPIAPFTVVAWIEAAGPRQPTRAIAWIAGAACLALAAWNATVTARCFHGGRERVPFFHAAPIDPSPFEQAAGWLQRETARDEPFASSLDPLLHLGSRRPGVSAWFNDQAWLESYFDRASDWRALYGGPPSRAAWERLFERASDVVAEYDRLGVRHVVLERAGTAGHPLHRQLVARMVAPGSPVSDRFERAFRSTDRSVEIWRLLPPPR